MSRFTETLAAHREGVETSSYVRGLTFNGECKCGKFTYDDVADHDRHLESMLVEAGVVAVERPLWEQAKDLMREQDRQHAWNHFCELSDVRCDCCGDRHAERKDYTCCGHHNHDHEYTDRDIVEALVCGDDCPPWSPFHDRAKTFPFSEYDASSVPGEPAAAVRPVTPEEPK